MSTERAARLALEARGAGRTFLAEPEGMEVMAGLGLDVPYHRVVDGPGAVPDLDEFPGDRVVVKLLAPDVAHRTEVGGVAVVPRTSLAVVRAVEEMGARTSHPSARFLLAEYVPHDLGPGGEILLGARWTREFGTVVTLALGGVATEVLAAASEGAPGASRTWSATAAGAAGVERALAGTPLEALLTGGYRGRTPWGLPAALADVVRRFMAGARELIPFPFHDIEVNPLVFRDGRAVALDALIRLAPEGDEPPSLPRRDASRRAGLHALLHPRSLGVVGASASGMNPGRVILGNVLAAGMPPAAVTVVKAGVPELDGCRCVPDVASLPPVDVLVVSVGAAHVPAVVEEAVGGHAPRAIVLTSGGLGEGGTDAGAGRRVRALLAEAGAPVLNGGNCLGIRSVPGRYDTLFIPSGKLGFPDVPPHPVALVTQSGAFAIARTSALPWLNPRFVVTVGNQLDATLGEWAEHLVDEPGLDVLGFYAEGFQPGDGLRFVEAARAHRERGRQVILFRGGRTPAGRDATASHTASLAGDYVVTRALAAAAGVLVAETVDDFTDLLALAVRLAHRTVEGPAAGLVSNAGFECVAMADSLGGLRPAALTPSTRDRLSGILDAAGVGGIVAPQNPLDLTPTTGDAAFVDAARALLDDPGVQVGVVGCVPLTPALKTLPRGRVPGDDVEDPHGVAAGLADLWRDTDKAWVAAVDGGPLYDALARRLEEAGLPVLRRADRAAALLARYVGARLER